MSKWTVEQLNGKPAELYRKHPRAGRADFVSGFIKADQSVVTFIVNRGGKVTLTQEMIDGAKYDRGVLMLGDYPR
jgi:hypothetical protein